MQVQVQAGGTSQAGNSSQSTDNNVSSEVQHIFAEAKDFNTTIEKSVIAQFSINLNNMYKNGKRLKNAIEKTLKILLKLHLQPKKERIRRKYINELQTTSDTSHTVVTENSIFSRNKKRYLFKRYRKQLQKYQEKNKTNKANKIDRKIEHIKELQWKKKPKRKKVIAKADTTDQDVETVIEENNEVNISGRRLAKLKGILKSLLYNYDAETINKHDIEISDLSEKEFSVCSMLFSLLKQCIPQKGLRYTIPAQLPFIFLSSILFDILGYKKHTIKVCPRPQPSSLLCLPLDTAMLYTLLTGYGEQMFDLVFRPGLVNCILTDVSLNTISATTTPISSKQSAFISSSSEERQSKEKRLKDLKEITTLNAQLLKKKKAFSLEKIDKEIRKMKKERNAMADKDDRRMAAVLIKTKKEERWRDFNELEVFRQELKALRREGCTCRNVCAKTYYYV
ncbi:hypothetical protein G6F70_004031 [Rhizopus microsporus]|nr:hypothetical protein G6F71_003307 [Rhizopus microsporus]KAG1200485.1 hypothetical protein G6F70_004031 [Rhizopus microsporus]KAG1214148.1 hypothetical protein G6F69_002181 [Rhizopus microsporus]KAG1234124.1 hypothetical protein G6F67_003760 [Rhizopus microsporus]KAG1266338.1 hypothetical protein G6F68_002842 [Rhizopus microsporus]